MRDHSGFFHVAETTKNMKNRSADGLRGVAAFSVAIMHFIAAFLPMVLHNTYPAIFAENKSPDTAFKIVTSPLATLFYNGHLAVLIFFVLSGYVLTLPYFDAPGGAMLTLKKRLWSRYLRLNIPIAGATLLSFAVYKFGLYSNVQASEISGSFIWLKSFYPNDISSVVAAKDAFYDSIVNGDGKLIPPLWTLKIEFIGSIFLLLFYISKPPSKTLVPSLLVFFLLYVLFGQDSIYYYAIFFGSYLHTSPASSKFALFAVGLYFGSFQLNSIAYDFLPSTALNGHDAWEKAAFYRTIGAVLITAAVVKGFGARFFGSKAIQFLGKISFSLYLIHFIILCSLSSYLYIHSQQSPLVLAGIFSIYVFACIVASMIFERVVDRRAINIAHGFAARFFTQSPTQPVRTEATCELQTK